MAIVRPERLFPVPESRQVNKRNGKSSDRERERDTISFWWSVVLSPQV